MVHRIIVIGIFVLSDAILLLLDRSGENWRKHDKLDSYYHLRSILAVGEHEHWQQYF